ncbi:MAG: phage tail sheath family protein [Candidatus Thorarchaeota archaeon]
MTPVQTSYPGVYIQEVPTVARTIAGVSTSITVFIGLASAETSNPLKPKRIVSYQEYEREFGPPHPNSDLASSVRMFFQNGGSVCYIINIIDDAVFASNTVKSAGGSEILEFKTVARGRIGNLFSVKLSKKNGTYDVDVFLDNLKVETIKDCELLGSDNAASFTKKCEKSEYIRCETKDATKVIDTFASNLVNSEKLYAKLVDGRDNSLPTVDVCAQKYKDAIDNLSDIDIFNLMIITRLDEVAPEDATAPVISFRQPLNNAIVDEDQTGDGVSDLPIDIDVVWTCDDPNAKFELYLNDANRVDLIAGSVTHTYQVAAVGGYTIKLIAIDTKGNTSTASVTFTVSDQPDFVGAGWDSLPPAIVPSVGMTDQAYRDILEKASPYCKQRRAFLLIDPLSTWTTKDITTAQLLEIRDKVEDEYCALYFPHIVIREYNPVEKKSSDKKIGPAAAVAGIISDVDASRGVWKAPAGINTDITGVESVSVTLIDEHNGVLNLQAVNCLRTFPAGTVVWGARTVAGFQEGEWKYIPIRRLALYIEESLYRGTQWVVFEPNDEPTWAAVRATVTDFMMDLFRKGAFQGSSPKEAFFVKCDKDTTTERDRNLGVLNIIIGFAPLKPAEFVVIQIQQISQFS